MDHMRPCRAAQPTDNPQRRRQLAVLDIENHVPHGPRGAAEADFAFATHRFAAAGDLAVDDHLIVGCAPKGPRVFGVRAAWPGALVRTRRGIDGADRALIDELSDTEWIRHRFDSVVIGSGDHAFVDPVIALNESGVKTIVVSWPESLNRSLRMAASEVRLLTATASVWQPIPAA